MKNTPLQGPSRVAYYTDLALVFQALGGRQKGFKWLLTDLECDWMPPVFAAKLNDGLMWLSGEELTSIVEQYRIQFVWGILSGFALNTNIDLAHDTYPYADGNPMFCGESPAVQHPQAIVEIVCWDSTATLLLSKDSDLSARFRAFFPEGVDLEMYNRSRRSN